MEAGEQCPPATTWPEILVRPIECDRVPRGPSNDVDRAHSPTTTAHGLGGRACCRGADDDDSFLPPPVLQPLLLLLQLLPLEAMGDPGLDTAIVCGEDDGMQPYVALTAARLFAAATGDFRAEGGCVSGSSPSLHTSNST